MWAIETRGILGAVRIPISDLAPDESQNPFFYLFAGVVTLFVLVALLRRSDPRPVRRNRTVELWNDEFVFNPADVYRLTRASSFQQGIPVLSVAQHQGPFIDPGKPHIKIMEDGRLTEWVEGGRGGTDEGHRGARRWE